jgi:hypothetical protein
MHFPLLARIPLLVLLAYSVGGSELRNYKNPIIGGFAPDPSCTRVEDRFFCVTSSFSAFPGIPVYTSRDLVQWEQIGNVLSRREQLPGLEQVNTTTGGVWAATIRFNRGTYYVSVTMNLDRLALLDPGRFVNVSEVSVLVVRPHAETRFFTRRSSRLRILLGITGLIPFYSILKETIPRYSGMTMDVRTWLDRIIGGYFPPYKHSRSILRRVQI